MIAYIWRIMADELPFIIDIQKTLKSAFDVNDWVTIKELIEEIDDFLESGDCDDGDNMLDY